MKKCRECLALKPYSSFYAEPRTKDGLRARCAECMSKYFSTFRAANPDHCRVKDRRQNKLKRAARISARHAIKTGKLLRQPCEVCGAIKVDAHHDDYSKRLDVRWLCRKHHAEFHKQTVV